MPKADQIQDEDLRNLMTGAHECMRNKKAAEAVRAIVDAFRLLLTLKPDLATKTVEFRPGRSMPFLMRWPALGANS